MGILTIATPIASSGYVTTFNLSVLASYIIGVTNTESLVTYTWSCSGVTFSINGTNASKNTVATIPVAGTYVVLMSAFAQGNTVSSSITINAGLQIVFDPVVSSCNVNTSIPIAYSLVTAGDNIWSMPAYSGNPYVGSPYYPGSNPASFPAEFGLGMGVFHGIYVFDSSNNSSYFANQYGSFFDQHGTDITMRPCNTFNVTQAYTGFNTTPTITDLIAGPGPSFTTIGTLVVQIVQSNNTLTYNVQLHNTSTTCTFTAWSVYLMNFELNANPTSVVSSTGLTPDPAYLVWDKGMFVATSPPSDPRNIRLLQGGNAGNNVLQLVITSNFPEYNFTGLASTPPPLGPGQSDSFTITLQFGDPDINSIGITKRVAQLCPQFYTEYAALYPYSLNWPDRRPITELFFDHSEMPAGDARFNDHSYVGDPTVFRNALLSLANSIGTACNTLNAQGFIAWDLEGGGRNCSYYGDPRQIVNLFPIMGYRHDPNGPALIDEFYSTIKSYGVRLGIGTRAQNITYTSTTHPYNNCNVLEYTSGEAAVTDMVQKLAYARNRWGCTMFYMDSSVVLSGTTSNGQPGLDPKYMRQIAQTFPDCVIFPEWKNNAFYQFCMPYNELRQCFTGTDAQIKTMYPQCGSYIWVGDDGTDGCTLRFSVNSNLYVIPAETGDIIASHAPGIDGGQQSFFNSLSVQPASAPVTYPTFVPITANAANTIVVYRSGDSASLSVAQAYQAVYNLSPTQLCGIPCTATEILADWPTFQSQVEQPILDFIYASNMNPGVIVTVFNVPGGFNDGSDVISTTSRMMVIGSYYTKNATNPFYNRQSSQRLSGSDLLTVRAAGRIDGPTVSAALAMVAASAAIVKAKQVSGTFYLDPWQVTGDSNSIAYAAQMSLFMDNTYQTLNLPQYIATQLGNTDVVIPFVTNDSFIWSCGNPSADSSFFRASASTRVFLFNADSANAATIRSATSTRWPTLAVLNGYAATAGSMSFATGAEDHYMNPTPFFQSVLQGATLGEAYAFSVQYLSSPETFIGDPLVAVSFPFAPSIDTALSLPIAVDLMMDRLSQAAASVYQMSLHASAAAAIANTWGSPAIVSAFNVLTTQLSTGYVTTFCPVAQAIMKYGITSTQLVPTNATVSSLLTSNGIMTGKLFGDELANYGLVVPSTQLLAQGAWQFDFVLQNLVPVSLSNYQFELQVATDSGFTNIVISKNSASTQTGWLYQSTPATFTAIPSTGVPSSFAGRRIRYRSNITTYPGETLTRGTLYYVRYRQKVGVTEYSCTSTQMGVYS